MNTQDYTVQLSLFEGPLDLLLHLVKKHELDILDIPVSFVTDHIETLHELDVEYGHLAKDVGITRYRRSPSLNTRPSTI